MNVMRNAGPGAQAMSLTPDRAPGREYTRTPPLPPSPIIRNASYTAHPDPEEREYTRTPTRDLEDQEGNTLANADRCAARGQKM